MNGRRRLTMLLAVTALAAASLASIPAQAAGGALCFVNATAHLSQTENLLNVTGGSGTLSGSMTCRGAISGATNALSGNFAFCRHDSSTSHTPQCASPQPQPNLEPIFNGLAPTTIISHVTGSISVTLDTGISCSFSLQGHTIGIQAELYHPSFSCSNGFVPDITRVSATAVTLPSTESCGGPPAYCFRDLAFVGTETLIDT